MSKGALPVPSASEGQILAHRQLLARLIRSLPDDARADLAEWLAERVVLRDGQEDPGAVQDEALATELALAEEFRLLRELAGLSR